MRDIRVVYAVPSLSTRDGGPSYTVAAGASATLRQPGVAVTVATRRESLRTRVALDPAVDHVELSNSGLRLVLESRRILRPILDDDGVVLHDQGIWHPQNLGATSIAASLGRPYAVSTHGMLEPWALGSGRLKKRLARALYQDRLLRGARCLVASSMLELRSIRSAGFGAPVAVIPHGIDVDIASAAPRQPGRTRTALFLSRIHPKKGLIHALEAWSKLRPEGWHLKIVGPGDDAYVRTLRDMVARLGLEASVSLQGGVSGAEKTNCYRQADLFLLPTYSENFGVVVAEALAHGLPVITTTGTPWEGLHDHHCGWIVEPGTEPLLPALTEALNLDRSALRSMGENGARWIAAEFRWDEIARRNVSLYRWMLGEGARPDFIHG